MDGSRRGEVVARSGGGSVRDGVGRRGGEEDAWEWDAMEREGEESSGKESETSDGTDGVG